MLRELELIGLNLSFSSSIYNGLRAIRLEDVPFDLPVAAMISMLSRCPLLEVLDLRLVSFMDSANPPPIPALLHLPHLQLVNLTLLDASLMRFVFASVIASPSTSIRIRVQGSQDTPQTTFPPIAKFAESFPGIASIDALSLKTASNFVTLLTISGVNSGTLEEPLELTFILYSPDLVDHAIVTVRKDLPAFSPKSLVFSTFTHQQLGSATFGAFLEDWPTVASLSLDDCPTSWVKMLARKASVRCPALTTLHLKNMKINASALLEAVQSHAPSHDGHSDPSTQPSTYLSCVEIHACTGVDADVVSQLRELVPNVTWDGR